MKHAFIMLLLSLFLLSDAQVQVEVAYTGPGRGHVLLAKQALKRGDLLAAIPTDLCWVFAQHGGGESVDVSGCCVVASAPCAASDRYPLCCLNSSAGLGLSRAAHSMHVGRHCRCTQCLGLEHVCHIAPTYGLMGILQSMMSPILIKWVVWQQQYAAPLL